MSLYGNPDKVQNSAIASAKKADSAVMKTDGSGTALPTADPAIAGALWSNAGIVTVSAG